MRDRWDAPKARLGELREAGVSVWMSCPTCHATWTIEPAEIAGDDMMPLPALAASQRCGTCGRHGGIDASPDPQPWVRWLRRTKQHHRLPFYAPMIRDDDEPPAPG